MKQPPTTAILSQAAALTLLLLAATGALAAVPHRTMNELTVRVLCVDRDGEGIGSGSGLVVGAGDHVATNWHVVECTADGGSAVVLLDAARRESMDATVRLQDAERDLALLRLAVPLARPAPRFATLSTLERLDRVIAVGFPGAADDPASPAALSEATFTEGVVSRILPDLSAAPPLVQISAAINPGNSGGPLFDRAGRVIGLNTAKALVAVPTVNGTGDGVALQRIASGEGIGWAVASDALLPLLDRAGIPYRVSRDRLSDWLPTWAADLGPAALLVVLLAGAIALLARRQRPGAGRQRAPAAPPRRRPVLRGLRGPWAGAEIPLDRGPVAIGRDPARTQLVLPPSATAISQRHALVRYERTSGRFFVEDCGSTNGVWLVDPASEQPGTPLPPGQAHRLEPGMGFYLATPEIAFTVGFV